MNQRITNNPSNWPDLLFQSTLARFNSNQYNPRQKIAIDMIRNHLDGVPQRSNSSVTSNRTTIPHEHTRNYRDVQRIPLSNKIVASSIIIGPPGTGKTEVICIGSILRAFNPRNLRRRYPQKLFIGTFTNAGSYRIFEKFAEICSSFNISNYHERIKIVQSQHQQSTPGFNSFIDQFSPSVVIQSTRPSHLDPRAWSNYLEDFYIIIGTVFSLSSLSTDVSISSIIYDEASQLTVPQYYLPIPDNNIRSICVVGDDQQLPPVATLKPLATSALEYLQGHNVYQNLPIPFNRRVELQMQYRMHPAIGQLTEKILKGNRTVHHGPNVSNLNYKLKNFNSNRLPRNLSQAAQDTIINICHPDFPVVIIDTSELPNALNQMIGSSRINPAERDLSLIIYKSLLRCYPRPSLPRREIIVTSPYKAQTELLRELPVPGARAGTIHQFQGQESLVVLYNLTFAEYDTPSSFFSQLNLMYVGLSRAQCKLIIIGNKDALNDPNHALQHVKRTIFNYQYNPRANLDPSYSVDPFFHIRINASVYNDLINNF